MPADMRALYSRIVAPKARCTTRAAAHAWGLLYIPGLATAARSQLGMTATACTASRRLRCGADNSPAKSLRPPFRQPLVGDVSPRKLRMAAAVGFAPAREARYRGNGSAELNVEVSVPPTHLFEQGARGDAPLGKRGQ
jgi:hypothetical protein